MWFEVFYPFDSIDVEPVVMWSARRAVQGLGSGAWACPRGQHLHRLLGVGMQLLELLRREVSKRRVEPQAVVEGLDVVEHRKPRGTQGCDNNALIRDIG